MKNTSGDFKELPPLGDVVKREREQSAGKENQRIVARVIFVEEFANHPNAVSAQPEHDGKVVNEFVSLPSCFNSQIPSHRQSWNNHTHAQNPKILNPTGVFNYPKQNVKIFNAPDFL
ncbi:MAG: hypothetical protein ABIP71_03860, partial [Verrucomicrobiota bacterium]